MKNSILYLASGMLLFSSCAGEKKQGDSMMMTPGINLEMMDLNTSPKTDFYKFVNGKWMETATIPDDRSRWGSFDELRQKTDEDVLVILDKAMNEGVTPGSDQEKAVTFYQSILDVNSRDQQGVQPIMTYLEKIDAITSVADLQSYLANIEKYGGGGFIGVGVYADLKNSSMNTTYMGPGSLGLPDREYYVADDADSKEKRDLYEKHITRMLQFIGDTEVAASKNAATILAFETALAVPRMTKEESRDARKRYNPMTVADLTKAMPSMDWRKYLDDVGFTSIETIVVSNPKYIAALEGILKQYPVDDWKQYLRWSVVNSTAGFLSTEIELANWEFYGKALRGAKKQRPRDERALQTVNRGIGEALGKLYVDAKFPAEAKQKAKSMVDNILKAYEMRIKSLDWMSEETKVQALKKLSTFTVKIGYPDQWKDYSSLMIESGENGGSYLQNMLNINEWNYNDDLTKIGEPVDKSEWGMSPQTVNAYYNPVFNEIVFPAAILQPPFYNYMADEAVNYGGIGAVIGHEISHGFDDSGSRFDADGNLNNWWSDTDLENFTERGGKLIAQYDALEPLPEIHVNGEFTLGENIGDLGGVNSAYSGLQLHLEKTGMPEPIDGYTAEQRFFISWATVWRTIQRDEALKTQIKTDPHAPAQYRGYIPLMNVDAFVKAFDIQEGDAMYIAPEERVRIW